MSDVTLYILEVDQTALGLCFAAVLGIIGCLAFGAMRADIARERPALAPIEHLAAVARAALDTASSAQIHRQPQSL